MLRPSRPMMRPFSSSDLSSTTDTVVSTAWLDATRCITAARMLRARRSASWRVSSSTWRISARALVAQLVLELAHHDLLRLSGAQAGHALELAQLVAPARPSAPRACGRGCAARSSSARSRSLELLRLAARASPPCARRRSSSRASSARRARSSSSRSSRAGRAAPPRPARPRGSGGAGATPLAACAGARALHQQRHRHRDRRRDQRRQHDLHLASPSSRRSARRHRRFRAVCSAPRDTRRPSKRRARPGWRAHGAALWTLPNAPLRAGRGVVIRSGQAKEGDLLVFCLTAAEPAAFS